MRTFWSELVENARRISAQALDEIGSRAQWEPLRVQRRNEFFEMVGLGVLPRKCALAVQSFGMLKGPGYRIEKLSFQTIPDVRVTASLYLPDGLQRPAPAVLYPCGHSQSGTQWYQPQGELWARRGYVCLVFNTLEQADCLEAGGDHHGLCSEKRFDWISRGYASTGGELWNSLRALDLLLARPEVDPARVGVTGISGGGALSWWIAVADERVKAAAPFCGTSTIGSYVADRTLNGHCDCIFYHNIFERDLADVGALIAPRPLLVCSATHDALFHPTSYREVVERLKKVYGYYGVSEQVDLCEYPGTHGYSAAGHVAVQKWFDRYVAGEERAIYQPEPARFSEKELACYEGAPPSTDRMALLPELLSVPGRVPHSDTLEELADRRRKVGAELRRTTFHHFPGEEPPLALAEVGAWQGVKIFDFTTEGETRLRLWLYDPWEKESPQTVLGVMGPGDRAEGLCKKMREFHPGPLAIVEPRGTGTLSWNPSQDWMLTRAGLLVGRTPESVRVWDALRGVQALRAVQGEKAGGVFLFGQGPTGVLALHVALLDEEVAGVLADAPPWTHAEGPYLLGVLRVLDVPQLAGLIAPRPVGLVNVRQRQFQWAGVQYARVGCAARMVLASTTQYAAEKMWGKRA